MFGILRIAVWVFAALYLIALGLLLIGTFGLFGQPADPLSGVFLIPLGLPWIFLVDLAPEPLLPWLAAASPAVNLVLMLVVLRGLGRRKSGAG